MEELQRDSGCREIFFREYLLEPDRRGERVIPSVAVLPRQDAKSVGTYGTVVLLAIGR